MMYVLVFSFCLTTTPACQSFPVKESFPTMEDCNAAGRKGGEALADYMETEVPNAVRMVLRYAGFMCHVEED